MTTIKLANWHADQTALREIRRKVFIEEQHVPEELEWDGLDDQASHWLALEDGIPAGTVRMLADGHIGRMAVLRDFRGQGIGSDLLLAAVAQAEQDQLYDVFLYAQLQAQTFYQRAGFIGAGNEFMDAGIPHTTMRRILTEQRQVGVHGGNFAVPDCAATIMQLTQQADRKIRILSPNLEPDLFDSDGMTDALSALARKHRDSEVQILILDSKPIVRRGHRLLKLHRRLSSSVKIRKPANAAEDIKEALVITDQIAVFVQSIREPDKRWANFNNRPMAEDYCAQFDELWHRSIDDPELRTLVI